MEKKDKYRRMLKTEKYEATGTLSSPLSGWLWATIAEMAKIVVEMQQPDVLIR
jgi:tRNA U55 pseudouridine synthase TruB